MQSANNPKNKECRTSWQSSHDGVNAALARGAPGAWPSALVLAIVVAITLWFGDFASERIGPAWEVIKHEAVLLRHELVIGKPDPSSGKTAVDRSHQMAA
jgi:hypothetical protein